MPFAMQAMRTTATCHGSKMRIRHLRRIWRSAAAARLRAVPAALCAVARFLALKPAMCSCSHTPLHIAVQPRLHLQTARCAPLPATCVDGLLDIAHGCDMRSALKLDLVHGDCLVGRKSANVHTRQCGADSFRSACAYIDVVLHS